MQWRGGKAIESLVPLGLTVALFAAYGVRDQGNRLWERLPPSVRGTVLAGLLGLVTYVLLYRHGIKEEFIYTQF
jgi:uncharacterized membrane protein (GlpM family)